MPIQFGWKLKLLCVAIEVVCALAVIVPAYFILNAMFDPESGTAKSIILLTISLSLGTIVADMIRKSIRKRRQRYE